MKILLCHNYYQQPGGEDQVFADEGRLLEAAGHDVVRFTMHNDALKDMGRLRVAGKTLWNRAAHAELREVIRRHRPAVMHCANTFPLMSPAVYYAARKEGVAVVQTLHNYRLICPGALLTRDSKVCEACVGCTVPWRSVVHGCYRGSRVATAVTASMLAAHRALGTWHKAVDRYIALTEFARQKFVAAGLPEDRIAVKPNCVCPDPGPDNGDGGFAVFAGRLVPEKGIDTLLSAWKHLHGRLQLKILGDGPLADEVRAASQRDASIEWLGPRPVAEVLDLVGRASMLVLPSTWYEGFPKTIVEAYAKGTPVVASKLGAMAEVVRHGETGVHFRPGDAEDLAANITQLLDQPGELTGMRRLARDEYEQHYTAQRNGELLEAIYEGAIEHQAEAGSPAVAEPVGAAGGAGLPLLAPVATASETDAPAPEEPFAWPAKVDLFGVQVTPTTYEETSEAVMRAARQGVPGVVSCHAVHALVTSSQDAELREKVNEFNIVTPDGQPVRWALNLLHGARLRDRVYGPELMLRLCAEAAKQGVSIYLYGGTPEVAETLRGNLLKRHPGLEIAGCESPPFRSLTDEESRAVVERINGSGAGLLFIGLGCPKQDLFAAEHRDSIKAVQLCVGAAFDFHAGNKSIAPQWMQRRGLEWLYRLVKEPRRLWRRYLTTNSVFLAKLVRALLGRIRIRPRDSMEPTPGY